MKVKKYVATSMPEAMKLIRADLGNDAVILNSKIVHTGGFLGFFRKQSIEVIAAMDEVAKAEPRVKEKPKMVPVKNSMPLLKDEPNSKMPPVKAEKPTQELLNEISELKALLGNMPQTQEQTGIAYPGPIRTIDDKLTSQGVDSTIRKALMMSLIEKFYSTGSNADNNEVKEWCRSYMVNRISGYTYGEITFSKKYVNVVGPTGVGKTTTLAKIAADSILKYNKKVAMITTDTYRIAAIEQLKTYANILSIPLEVCYSIEDFTKACKVFHDYDVVLIDTAGRNFRNSKYVEELKKIIDYSNDMETYLVLALTSKQDDMEEIYKQFSSISIDQFIFTKIDETASYGSMYNMIDKYKIGAAYLTHGQDVPDDRVPASAEVITNLILEDEMNERPS